MVPGTPTGGLYDQLGVANDEFGARTKYESYSPQAQFEPTAAVKRLRPAPLTTLLSRQLQLGFASDKGPRPLTSLERHSEVAPSIYRHSLRCRAARTPIDWTPGDTSRCACQEAMPRGRYQHRLERADLDLRGTRQ